MEGGGVAPFSSSMAPSGSYILIIVSQPVNDEHKKGILERLNKGEILHLFVYQLHFKCFWICL